jgi:hypothetical protein
MKKQSTLLFIFLSCHTAPVPTPKTPALHSDLFAALIDAPDDDRYHFSQMVKLPALGLFPGTGSPAYNGIAVDPTNGDIWFTEFFRKRVGRLHEL